MTAPAPLRLHASTVALEGRGALILGASGAGKSGLALQLMGLGAGLVADDQTELRVHGGALWAGCPPAIAGLIEARGLGLLAAPPAGPVALALAVDLDTPETERLPPHRHAHFLGISLPLFRRVDAPYFASAILHCLKHGRSTRDV